MVLQSSCMDRVVSDIVHKLSKFMNFWVAKMYGNCDTSMKIQKYGNRGHELLP